MQSDERHCISTNLLKWTSSPPPALPLYPPRPLPPYLLLGTGAAEGHAVKHNGGTDSGFGARQLAQESSEGDDDDF